MEENKKKNQWGNSDWPVVGPLVAPITAVSFLPNDPVILRLNKLSFLFSLFNLAGNCSDQNITFQRFLEKLLEKLFRKKRNECNKH